MGIGYFLIFLSLLGLYWIFLFEIMWFKNGIFFWNKIYLEGFNVKLVDLSLLNISLRFCKVWLKDFLKIMILFK